MYPGMGSASACTAFQSSKSAGKWANVCYLTNHAGVFQPEIEFHWVSGSNGRIYASAVRFTGPFFPPRPLTLRSVPGPLPGQVSFCGTGACGATFVLLQSPDLAVPRNSWTPIATNAEGAGSCCFVIPMVAETNMFFRVNGR
jgi:hypothetical protein